MRTPSRQLKKSATQQHENSFTPSRGGRPTRNCCLVVSAFFAVHFDVVSLHWCIFPLYTVRIEPQFYEDIRSDFAPRMSDFGNKARDHC